MNIALDYLEPIKRAQLAHFGYKVCKRCGYGQIVGGQCLQCGAEHDENGQLIKTREAVPINSDRGGHHIGGNKYK